MKNQFLDTTIPKSFKQINLEERKQVLLRKITQLRMNILDSNSPAYVEDNDKDTYKKNV